MSTDTTLETKTNLAAADNSTTNNTLPTYRLKPNDILSLSGVKGSRTGSRMLMLSFWQLYIDKKVQLKD